MKKPGVQERIIETASVLFYNQGYNQTGINQIISEAGVAKASMYQHFRSKEDIAVAYLQQRHINWMEDLTSFVSTESNDKEKIIKSFDFLNSWLTSVDFRGCGFQNIICDLPSDHHKVKDQVVLHKNEVGELILSLLPKESSSQEVCNELLVLLEGAIILSQIQKNNWPITAAKNAAKKLLS
jgi:AcrR family transcriptional regulator